MPKDKIQNKFWFLTSVACLVHSPQQQNFSFYLFIASNEKPIKSLSFHNSITNNN